jgi:hypothetical protein
MKELKLLSEYINEDQSLTAQVFYQPHTGDYLAQGMFENHIVESLQFPTESQAEDFCEDWVQC